MADDATMYRSRAEAEMAAARETTLTNVRERCERSAKAWSEMATRAERTSRERLMREAATATRAVVAEG